MKILIVLIRWKGGVGRVVENQKKEFERLGHEVEIISREDDLKSFSTRDAFHKLRAEVDKRTYDILLTQDWSCALPLLNKKNHYVQFNGTETNNPTLQNIVAKIKKKNVIVIRKELKEKFPKATLAYVGVNLENFRDLKAERVPGTVGFANFEWDDYHYKEIKQAVDDLGLTLVKTNMNLTKEKLIQFYNKIETFISLPAKFAGFNMTWIEAMACGVPKIIGNYNGVGKELRITHLEDYSSITEVLKQAKDKRPYEINPEFDWEVHAKKILELFDGK